MQIKVSETYPLMNTQELSYAIKKPVVELIKLLL